MSWILILYRRASIHKWIQTSVGCVARRWKIPPISLMRLECLQQKERQRRNVKVTWHLHKYLQVWTTRNGTTTNQRSWSKTTKSRSCGISISKRTASILETTKPDITAGRKENVSSSHYIKVIWIENLTKYTEFQLEVARIYSIQASVVSVVIGKFGSIILNIMSYSKKTGIMPSIRPLRKRVR